MASSQSSSTATSRWGASLVGSAVAEIITLPLDLAKTRLQVEGGKRGLIKVIVDTGATEGPRALWKGLAPALVRQTCYTSMSMVIYGPIRDLLCPSGTEFSFARRLLAGGVAGSMSIFVFNWAEVVKVKIQASNEPLKMIRVMKLVYKNSGVLGFWAGVRPNVARTFVVNAAELGSYDHIKTEVFVPMVGDNALAQLGSSSMAGVISALVSTPVDVVKTRWMNEAGESPTLVKRGGILGRGVRIFREEGARVLYAGFMPICVRKVVWCTTFFCSYETLLGMNPLVTAGSVVHDG